MKPFSHTTHLETFEEASSLLKPSPIGVVRMPKAEPNPIFMTLRKIGILFVSLTFTNRLSLLTMGFLNRILGRPVRSIFLLYPAKEEHAHLYAFKSLLGFMRHNPLIVGFYFQNFRVGLVMAAYAPESYFRNNKDYLMHIHTRVDKVRRIVGAEFSHFAGTMPTEMSRFSLLEQDHFMERCDFVADIVVKSEKAVREMENLYEVCPVLLLGGKGNIGKSLKNKFLEQGREVYIIDMGEDFPKEIVNRKAILIDVSRKGALESRAESLWNELVILNERFPQPDPDFVQYLNGRGINVYHVVGVKAQAFPRFPYGYAGGVPCCAAIRHKNVQSMVRKLS